MRYASITHALARQALDDAEIGGLPAKPGTVFTVMAMTANRDPKAFPEPERFDAARSPCPHLTFGFGSHACVGAPLARMEMVEAFTELARSIERVELIRTDRPGPTCRPVWFRPNCRCGFMRSTSRRSHSWRVAMRKLARH